MPLICRFQGIKIYVYYRDHAPPHVHAEYNGDWAVIAISDGHVIEGSLPKHTLKIAQDWTRKHTDALTNAWDAAANGKKPGKIGSSNKKGGRRRG